MAFRRAAAAGLASLTAEPAAVAEPALSRAAEAGVACSLPEEARAEASFSDPGRAADLKA